MKMKIGVFVVLLLMIGTALLYTYSDPIGAKATALQKVELALLKKPIWAIQPDEGQILQWDAIHHSFQQKYKLDGVPLTVAEISLNEQWIAMHSKNDIEGTRIVFCKGGKCSTEELQIKLKGIDQLVAAGSNVFARSGELSATMEHQIAVLDTGLSHSKRIVSVPGVVQQIVAYNRNDVLMFSLRAADGERLLWHFDDQRNQLHAISIGQVQGFKPSYIQFDQIHQTLLSVWVSSENTEEWYVQKDRLSEDTLHRISQSDIQTGLVQSVAMSNERGIIAIALGSAKTFAVDFIELEHMKKVRTQVVEITPAKIQATPECLFVSNDEQSNQQCLSWDQENVYQMISSDQLLWF